MEESYDVFLTIPLSLHRGKIYSIEIMWSSRLPLLLLVFFEIYYSAGFNGLSSATIFIDKRSGLSHDLIKLFLETCIDIVFNYQPKSLLWSCFILPNRMLFYIVLFLFFFVYLNYTTVLRLKLVVVFYLWHLTIIGSTISILDDFFSFKLRHKFLHLVEVASFFAYEAHTNRLFDRSKLNCPDLWGSLLSYQLLLNLRKNFNRERCLLGLGTLFWYKSEG